MPDWNTFLAWGFKLIVAAGFFRGIKILDRLEKSVDRLNIKMATLIEKTSWHSKEINGLDHRVQKLESRK